MMTILMVTVDGMGEANCEVLKVLTNSNYTQENLMKIILKYE